MRTAIFTTLLAAAACAKLSAGSINVVHVGPPDPLKFQVSANGATQEFTLAHGATTGSFVLPNAPSTIKGYIESVPSLKIPAADEPRIAVLTPSEDGFKWHLVQAKPEPDKWAFRIINLSSLPVGILGGNEPLEIPAQGEKAIEVTGKSKIRVNIPDSIDVAYDGSEPCAVVAFVYREGEKWKAVFVPER